MEEPDYFSVCANASDSNVTSELWLVEERAGGIVLATFLLLFLVVGLPWNLLVIVTIVKQRLYTQPTIILLLSLASTDLILLVYLPLVMIVGFHGEYLYGDSDKARCSACGKTGFVSLLFSLNSTFNIGLMSIDRFLFIYKPLKYDRYVTVWRTLIAIALSWVVALVLSILPLAGFGNIVLESILCGINVNLENDYYSILVLVVFFLAITPVLVCNMWVCCIVQRNIRAIYKVRRSLTPSSDETHFYESLRKKGHEKGVHLLKVFGSLLCSNIISWLPIIIVGLALMAVSPIVLDASRIFLMLQAVLHPILETTLIKEVRDPLKTRLFSCYVAVRTRLSSCKNTSQVNTAEPKGQTNSGQETSGKRCGGDFMDICGAAVLFNHFQHSTSNSTAATHETVR
jgi:hypothetical protein